ncbi:MAG: tRNA uridine-5-carboxymethylaminomethyl(34) synthesis GTPase MnmE [Pseudomonadota bacterium]
MRELGVGDTICAIATPPGHGGIGVVRISGADARRVLASVWRGRVAVSDFEPRRLYLGDVGVDRVMAVFMPAPATYTGEDVVELSAHGSPAVLRQIMEGCLASGARAAGPGEFTRRAFVAGKLDLAQAEGVADLINATSERAARLAGEQLKGALSEKVSDAGDALATLRAEIEAGIDFPEENLEQRAMGDVIDRLQDIASNLKILSSTYAGGRLIREGARVAIVGRPNAGKSSIFNRLAGADRAIVHHEPGTTRDVVEEQISLGGLSFRLRDTAGLRANAGEIEAIGVGRAREEIAAADIVVAVFDGSRAWDGEDAELMATLDPRRCIAVINKCDLTLAFDPEKLPVLSGGIKPLHLSARTGSGIEYLASQLVGCAAADAGKAEGVMVASARHKALIDEALLAIDAAQNSLEKGEPAECAAARMLAAQDALGSITGRVTTDDILDRIFSTFCIGK